MDSTLSQILNELIRVTGELQKANADNDALARGLATKNAEIEALNTALVAARGE